MLGHLRRLLRFGDSVLYDGKILPAKRFRLCGAQFKSDAYFLASAQAEAERIESKLLPRAEGRLLDIGCGYGRLAIGLLARGTHLASYRGLDVMLDAIQWCERNISPRDSRFSFVHLDVRNERYNPLGGEIDRQLPVSTASVDVVYLYSVFSHMNEEDLAGCLREISRVLSADGRVFFSAFVEENVPTVSVNPEGYRREWSGALHCVRYERGHLLSLLAIHDLELVEESYGTETDGQSAFVVKRRH